MRSKEYYIQAITDKLDKCNIDFIISVYKTISKMIERR